MKKCRTSQTPLLINIEIFSGKSKEKSFLWHFCQVLAVFGVFRLLPNRQGKREASTQEIRELKMEIKELRVEIDYAKQA